MQVYSTSDVLGFYPNTQNLLKNLMNNKNEKMMIYMMDLIKERYKKKIPKKCYQKCIAYLYSCLDKVEEVDECEKEYQKHIIRLKLTQLLREKSLYFEKKAKTCFTCKDISVYHKRCECCWKSFCSVKCQINSH